MAITIGTQLGSHEIVALLGKGGMGEVYRARDTKLKREVAIKVLPDEFSRDADRLSRFQREAEVLASLNHPNIAAIYDLEEANGSQFLVLELVDGETIADRLRRGAIPVEEALEIAKHICEALEAAHEKGIVHRDLKPANVKVTPDGKVKVLDFGLARALEGAPANPNFSNSPTLSMMATNAGVILGTAAYMSPEQARGKSVDRRTDVWAFGCVLYEMLTGKRAFEGEEVTDILARIITQEPDWNALPAAAPPSIRRLLDRCLRKDLRRRLADVADARIELEELKEEPQSAPAERVARRSAGRWAIASALTFVLGALAVFLAWSPWRTPSPPAPLRLSTELGAEASMAINTSAALALSPDGHMLAFVGVKAGKTQLYIRRLAQLEAAPLAGTDDATNPFFSPDGQWIAFFSGGMLRKMSITGGAAVTLADAPTGRGGAWGEDGNIVFAPNAATGTNLQRVSSAGGKVESQTNLAEGEAVQRWPQVLPGGKGILYTANLIGATSFDDANIVVRPLPTGSPRIVQRGGYYGRYLPSGHLVYLHEGTLFAAPFDLDRLELAGQPVPAVERVNSNTANTGGAQFAFSNSGTLVYLPGQGGSGGNDPPVVWLTRDGKTTPLRSMAANWSNPHFSPDGRKLAMDIFDGKNQDVWVYEWARDTLTRFTFDPAPDGKPVWTPDGRRIVFTSSRDKSQLNLYWQRADNTGDTQRLTESKYIQLPASWHPSGRYFAFTEINPQTGPDLMILPMEGDETSGWKPGKPVVFLSTPAVELEPMFSPDGKWIAYFSNESGRFEVFVRPFPGPGGKWQISTTGGTYPAWSRARELFYRDLQGRIMVASYAVEGDSFKADKPRLWSDRVTALRPRQRPFDLHPDGERFAVGVESENQTQAPHDKVVFIFNFFDELRRIAPVSKK